MDIIGAIFHLNLPHKKGHKIEKKLHILSCCEVWSKIVFFLTKGARSKQQKLSHIPTHKTYHAAKEKVVAAIFITSKTPPQTRNIKNENITTFVVPTRRKWVNFNLKGHNDTCRGGYITVKRVNTVA